MMRAALLALSLAWGFPGAGQAQEHFLELTPSLANGFFPSTALEITAPDETRLEGKIEDALGGGIALGIRPIERLSVELEGILIQDAQSSTSAAELAPGFSADLPMTHGYYGVAVRYQLPVSTSRVAPFVVGGVGEKEFDPSALGTRSPFTGSFGAGIRLRIPGWPDVRTELRDYVSRIDVGQVVEGVSVEANTQHDLFWKVGAVLGVF